MIIPSHAYELPDVVMSQRPIKRKIAKPPKSLGIQECIPEKQKREERIINHIPAVDLPELVNRELENLLEHLSHFSYNDICLYSTLMMSKFSNLMIQARNQEQQREQLLQTFQYGIENT